MANNPKLTFYSGVGTSTGANFLLEAGGKSIMIDCGLIQGESFSDEANAEDFEYNPKDIDIAIITHAHLDHVGRLPKLVKDGFAGTIYSTLETRELAQLVLEDAVKIMNEEAGREAIYSLDDVNKVFSIWRVADYHESVAIGSEVSFVLKDAGHILGSAMIEVSVSNPPEDRASAGMATNKILFSGDLGNSPAPILRDTEPVGDADYLVIESVYGNRNHKDKDNRRERLQDIVKKVISKNGTLIIPAFAIDRAQILLYELNNMVESGNIPSIPVFLDSPMAIRATGIYARSDRLFNEDTRARIAKGDNIFSFPRLKLTMTNNESEKIDREKGAKIIIAGSGMSAGGRILGHEEKYLPDPESTILLIGYQAAGSLGRQIADGAKQVKIHDRLVKIRANIETIYGYSAHKDADHLLEFVAGGDNLKKVFVAMGELGASMSLTQRINEELNVKALIPEVNKRYEIG